MNKNSTKYILVALAMLLIVMAWYLMPRQSDKIIRIGYLPTLLSTPLYIANDSNIFEKQGIKTENVKFQSSNQLYDALAKNDIDIAVGVSILPIMINELKESGKVKIFSTSPLTKAEKVDMIIAKKAKNIVNIKQLENKKIGVFPGSTATTFLRNYLIGNGVIVEKIEFVQLPPANQLQALEAGSVDALYTYEPNVTIAQDRGDINVITGPLYPFFLEGSPIAVNAISNTFLTKNESLANKFVSTFDLALDKSSQDKNLVRAVLKKELGLSDNVSKNMYLYEFPNSREIDKEKVSQFVDILVKLGEIKFRPNLSNIFYK